MRKLLKLDKVLVLKEVTDSRPPWVNVFVDVKVLTRVQAYMLFEMFNSFFKVLQESRDFTKILPNCDVLYFKSEQS